MTKRRAALKFDYSQTGCIARIHPANDWFMRGVTYARIVKRGLSTGLYYCKDQHRRHLLILKPEDILEVNPSDA